MFTGIIECTGVVSALEREGSNLHIELQSPISNELKIDQSVAHNGVCLTVIACGNSKHRVTAILETLEKSNIGNWEIGTEVNLERCLRVSDRLDGHIVQGHVDTTAIVQHISEKNGSWEYDFFHAERPEFNTIPKGSITVNGVSLTVVKSSVHSFSVAIIPYTFEHTNFKLLRVGSVVNIEFDVIGKYIGAYLQRYGTIQ